MTDWLSLSLYRIAERRNGERGAPYTGCDVVDDTRDIGRKMVNWWMVVIEVEVG